MTENFECKRCGFCCRTLFVYEDGKLFGLSLLTQEETKLFYPEIIAPYVAIGVKEPTTIIFHQLILSECPYINEKNECVIYDKRPIVCRLFPRIPKPTQLLVTPNCPQVGKRYNRVGEICPLDFDTPDQEEALTKMDFIYSDLRRICIEKGLNLWVFDLATKRWMIQKE
jgi:Fe-S-cluster containining protein